MGTVEVPVLIVGGAGVGLSASVFLSDHGVGHLLVERRADTSRLPKVHYIDQRTMEIFRQHELAAEVIELGARTDEAAGPVLPVKLSQVRLEPVLRSHAEQRNPGRVLFGHELVSLAEDEGGEGVTAEIRSTETGETTTVTARYVIAADGGRTVGPAVGVKMEGLPALFDATTAYFSADLSQWWDEGTIITWFLDPNRPDLSGALVEMGQAWDRNCKEWGLHLPPAGLDRNDEQAVTARIREVLGLPELELTLHEVTNRTVEALIAERYRHGRVFLVGDAAHRGPPAVGLGPNTGIQDAHNLAWKLAAVVTGRAGDRLLDTYEAERRPVGRFNLGRAMSAAGHRQVVADAAIGPGPHVPPAVGHVRARVRGPHSVLHRAW